MIDAIARPASPPSWPRSSPDCVGHSWRPTAPTGVGRPWPRRWPGAGSTGPRSRPWTTPPATSTGSASPAPVPARSRPASRPRPAPSPGSSPSCCPPSPQLTERQRVAVVLVHGFGWTLREVAELTDVAVTSVQNHVERGLEKLRTALEVHPMPEPPSRSGTSSTRRPSPSPPRRSSACRWSRRPAHPLAADAGRRGARPGRGRRRRGPEPGHRDDRSHHSDHGRGRRGPPVRRPASAHRASAAR